MSTAGRLKRVLGATGLAWSMWLSIEAAAITPAPRSHLSVRGGYDFIYLQGPSLEREDRLSYFLSGHYTLLPYLRGETFLSYAPDPDRVSRQVDVRQDFVGWSPAIAVTYVKWFRYSLSLGPTFLWTKTSYELKGAGSDSFTSRETAITARLGIEYAFSPSLELVGNLGWQQRQEPDKLDWMFGLSLAFYPDAFPRQPRPFESKPKREKSKEKKKKTMEEREIEDERDF